MHWPIYMYVHNLINLSFNYTLFNFRFTKNLSPDKINLSTLKGEGELSNLELDEAILMDLLDLPTWMKLTKAVCNKVSIKVRYRKI